MTSVATMWSRHRVGLLPVLMLTLTCFAAREIDAQQLAPATKNAFAAGTLPAHSETHEVSLVALDADLDKIDPAPFAPQRKSLTKWRGVHPRLFLTSKRVAELRRAVLAKSHQRMWLELRTVADWLVQRGPPAYRQNDGWSGREQLWQREIGDQMPTLALAYLVSGDEQYLKAARSLALASCRYPTWGLQKLDGVGLAAGHQLAGLALVYDWCHDDLGDEARQIIRDTLIRQTAAMYEAAAHGKRENLHRMYLDNHMWISLCGVSLAGLALFDEVDEASMWIWLPLAKLTRSLNALGPDGASHEGLNYWAYGLTRLMMFMHVTRDLLNVELWDHPWLENGAAYLQYLTLPRKSWTSTNRIVDFADSPRYLNRGGDYLLHGLARYYHDGHAQWLARQMHLADGAEIPGHLPIWLRLIWFDPGVTPRSPESWPTIRWFKNLGIVSARSDWSGEESLVVFKCGPCIGHKAIQEFDYDPGAGHVHPDANHFVLFAAGQWLLRDDGYSAKWTGRHNTLLIEGQGQLGQGGEWFDAKESLRIKAQPRVLSVTSTASLDHIAGNATEAYPARLGLKKYIRHLLFVKELDVLLVIDDITLARPATLELRFHPENNQAAVERQAWLVPGPQASLRIAPLTNKGVEVVAEQLPPVRAAARAGQSMFTVSLRKRTARWRNAVALSWAAANQPTREVVLNGNNRRWNFKMPGGQVRFDWTKQEATFVP